MWNSVDTKANQVGFFTGRGLPWLVLAVLLLYTYAKFFEHPYYGFRWSSENREVFAIYVPQDDIYPPLQKDDVIVQIGPLRLDDFLRDLTMPMFDNVRYGEEVPLRIEHQGEERIISWIFPGPNREEVLDLVYSEGWLAFAFWLAGTLVLIHFRPKDERWYLLIAFNYLTSMWLTFGSGLSQYHIWGAAILLRVGVWFSIPVYLHLHWVFPRPLGKLHPLLIWGVYLLTAIFAVAELFQVLPNNLYSLGLLVALLGSVGLLIIHAIIQPESRRDLRLLFFATILAFVPVIVIGFIGTVDEIPVLAGGALLGFPLIPFAYLYSAYRYRWRGLEVRINRLISIYLFLTMLFAALFAAIALTAIRFSLDGNVPLGLVVLIGTIFSIFASIVTILGFPKFRTFIEHRIFGIPLPSKRLLEIYSARITTSDLLSDLVRVLETEIIPSLLIRQFVFLQFDNGSLKVLSKLGVNEEQIPAAQDIPDLTADPGVYRSPDSTNGDQPYPWIRLVLHLKLGEETNGFWLFGRRDPDDIYSQLEIPILQSLASQTAVALSNILQTERLASMYEGNIDRYEQESLRLSRDLHDSIMNEMAALLMRSDAPIFSPEFQQAFEALTERLREIVSDLRPPSLNFGLKPALEYLADSLLERNKQKVKIVADIQADGEWRYPDKVENHLYRIVQEACGNALKYAHAKTIRIAARLSRAKIELIVEDDGVGFSTETRPSLDYGRASKHYGLTGMHERASLIAAQVNIDARLGHGTRILVTWQSNKV